MEVIQWYTGSVTKPVVPLDKDKATKHCLFRLDIIDRELLSEDTLNYIRNENAKYTAEWGNLPTKNLQLHVTEEDTELYKMKCLENFALLIGLLKPGENIVDWIRKY